MMSARDLPLLQRLCEGDAIAPAEFCARDLALQLPGWRWVGCAFIG
jgi:hypothetical protein